VKSEIEQKLKYSKMIVIVIVKMLLLEREDRDRNEHSQRDSSCANTEWQTKQKKQ
jgi:hypothetical protein